MPNRNRLQRQQLQRASPSGSASRHGSTDWYLSRFESGYQPRPSALERKTGQRPCESEDEETHVVSEFFPFPPEPGLHADDRNFSNFKTMNTEILIPILSTAALGAAARYAWHRVVTVAEVSMHQHCIHSRHGRFVKLLDAGRHRFFGAGHAFQYFDRRLQQIALQTQELTTAEGITVKITAVGLYRIVDPVTAVSTTADFNATLYTLIQLALRDAVNGTEVEPLLSNVRSLGPKLLDVVKDKATNLGLELTELVVRDVILPTEIKSALSESWRSKKSALAEIEAARGKAAAARTMANAARLYETNPSLLKIRYIEAIEQASKGMGNTFVIGLADEKGMKLV